MRSDAFSPIMIVAALVLDETMLGMTELSQTRKAVDAPHPQFGIDHRHRVDPHLAGADRVIGGARDFAREILVVLPCAAPCRPGNARAGRTDAKAGCAMISWLILMPSIARSRS